MDTDLVNLLHNVSVESDHNSFTHMTYHDTIKRWKMNNDSRTEFWKGYCDLVYRKSTDVDGEEYDPDAKLCLAEKTSEAAPIISAFSFKFHFDENENLEDWEPYDDDFLIYLCHIYQSVIIENFHINEETQLELVAVVLESKNHWIENDPVTGQQYLIYEIKFHFPYGRVDIGSQKRLIRQRVIKLLHNTNALKYLKRAPVGGWEQIISSDIVESPVIMYGSSRDCDRPKLEMTHIWPWITIDMVEELVSPEEIPLGHSFEPVNHRDVQNNRVDDNIFNTNDDPIYWLPIFLSVEYWQGILNPKVVDNGRLASTQENRPQTQTMTGKWLSSLPDDKNIDLCEQMLPMIDRSKFFMEISWLDIGKALYHSDNGGESGLSVWVKSTQKAVIGAGELPKFMEASGTLQQTCKDLYQTFSGKPITVKTAAWYARLDNPEKYAQWHKEWCMQAIAKSISLTHTDVATAIYRIYWLDFLYFPPEKKWYTYKNNRWEIDDEALNLKGVISKDFVDRMNAVRAAVAADVRNDENGDANAENASATIKKIDTFIVKLKTTGYKESLVNELRIFFKNNKFQRCADANPNILGIANGILEISGNLVHFRSGKPEDYVVLNTNVPYQEDYTWESPLVVECMTWFGQVFPDKELLHHFLKFASSCLKGRNSDKIFPIFTGEGNNSKSMIVKIFEKTFGEYCIKFDMANVTSRNQNASGPTPQLARSKAVRVAFMDEAADDVPIHKETIKRVVGGDSFYTRKNYDNGGDIEVFFKLILSCNKVPIIPKADKAIKNRTRLFPFMSTWSADAPEDLKEQYATSTFKMDVLFEERIPFLASAFLWIMSKYYPYYSAEKLPDPPIIIEHTEAYWRDNDVYAQFAADCVTITPNRNANDEELKDVRVTFNEIYAQFRIWYKEAFDGTKIPEKANVKTDLQARWGKLHGQFFYGICLIDKEEGPVAPRQDVKIENKGESKAEIKKSPVKIQIPKIIEDNNPNFATKVKRVPETITQANLAAISINKLKGNLLNDNIGDIGTKMLSPGIIAGMSNEFGLEEDFGIIDF